MHVKLGTQVFLQIHRQIEGQTMHTPRFCIPREGEPVREEHEWSFVFEQVVLIEYSACPRTDICGAETMRNTDAGDTLHQNQIVTWSISATVFFLQPPYIGGGL